MSFLLQPWHLLLLVIAGRTLGRGLLEQLATIVTPNTILRWHRTLSAAKWNYNDRKKAGREKVGEERGEERCQERKWKRCQEPFVAGRGKHCHGRICVFDIARTLSATI
jgi:hypothetical protein